MSKFEEGKPITITIGPKIRFMFPNIFEKEKDPLSGKPDYNVVLQIPYEDTVSIDKVNDAIDEAVERGYGNTVPSYMQFKPGTKESELSIPFKDGANLSEKDYGGVFEGYMYIKAKNENRPGVVDANIQQVMDPEKLFSGCSGAASITVISYNNVTQGIKFRINHLMILDDSNRVGGSTVSAEDAFSEYTGASQRPKRSMKRGESRGNEDNNPLAQPFRRQRSDSPEFD